MQTPFGQFGQSPLFGLPSTDLHMNVYYAQQAQAHAERHPHDVHAQRQLQYWLEVVHRQQQGQPVAGPTLQTTAPPAPMGPGAQAPPAGPGASAPSAPATAPQMPLSFVAPTETHRGAGVH